MLYEFLINHFDDAVLTFKFSVMNNNNNNNNNNISTFINSARVTQCHNGAGWRQRLSSAHQKMNVKSYVNAV